MDHWWTWKLHNANIIAEFTSILGTSWPHREIYGCFQQSLQWIIISHHLDGLFGYFQLFTEKISWNSQTLGSLFARRPGRLFSWLCHAEQLCKGFILWWNWQENHCVATRLSNCEEKILADQSTELVGKESQNLQIRILKLLSYSCGF